jgi:hypothetical protein
MCDCKNKIKIILQNHKRCRFDGTENISEGIDIPVPIIIDIPVPIIIDIHVPIIIDIPVPIIIDIPIIHEPISAPVIEPIIEIIEPIIEIIEEYEEDIELTDISPQELIEQEELEKRIQDELSLIQLTKLLKKKPRKVNN